MPRRSQKAIASRCDRGSPADPRTADDASEIPIDDGGLASQPLLERELERPSHVLETVRVARVGTAGDAAPVKRECRFGEIELRGERQRPVGFRDRFAVRFRRT